jgi:hypothetical protein
MQEIKFTQNRRQVATGKSICKTRQNIIVLIIQRALIEDQKKPSL